MGGIIGNISQIPNLGVSMLQNVAVLSGTIVIGVIVGLFGHKLARVWATFVGFVLGIGIGAAVVYLADLKGFAMAGAILGCALVVAIIFCIFYKVGMFFFVWLLTGGVILGLLPKQSTIFIIIAFAIGLVAALLTIKFFDAIVIIATSLNGAVSAGVAIVSLLKLSDMLPAMIGIPAGLFVIFMIVQFIMKSKQVGKKQTEKAKEHKKKISRENDVEAARTLLDGDIEYDEEYDFGEDEYNPEDGEYYDDDEEYDDDDDYYYDDEEDVEYDDEYDDNFDDDDDFTFID